jgi:hypothetical protein
MKRILFCLILLLVFFRPTNSHATVVKSAYKFRNPQKEFTLHQENLQTGTDNYFSDDILDADDDDTDDPDEKNCSFAPAASESFYLFSYNFYNPGLKEIHYTGYSFTSTLPVFILLSVFRL